MVSHMRVRGENNNKSLFFALFTVTTLKEIPNQNRPFDDINTTISTTKFSFA